MGCGKLPQKHWMWQSNIERPDVVSYYRNTWDGELSFMLGQFKVFTHYF